MYIFLKSILTKKIMFCKVKVVFLRSYRNPHIFGSSIIDVENSYDWWIAIGQHPNRISIIQVLFNVVTNFRAHHNGQLKYIFIIELSTVHC